MEHLRNRALVACLGAVAFAACSPPPWVGPGLNEPCTPALPCAPGLVCSADRGNTCQFPDETNPLCVANSTKCDGANVLKCKSDGTGYDVTELCEGACSEGACVDQICTPGALACDLDAIVQCSPDGLTKVTVEVCSLGCDPGATGATPTCRSGICSPGSSRCIDGTTKIETCDAAGVAWEVADCADEGSAVCREIAGTVPTRAACELTVCQPGVIRCDIVAVMQCNAQGSGEDILRVCDVGCNSDGTCKAETLCIPGSVSCSDDGTVLQRCNALGTFLSSERCNLNGAGRCVSSPSASGAAVARCVQTVCTPATTQCNGDQLMLCADDGSGYIPTQQCEYGCAAGACKPAVCGVGERRCGGASAGVLEVCADDGRSFVFQEFCGSGCTADGSATGGARCNPQVCSPNFARCVAGVNAVERCSNDGQGYVTAGACLATQVCINGSCVVKDPTCNVGTQRCNGGDIEVCEAPTSGDNLFAKKGSCLGGCSGQACDAAGECGPISLSAVGLRGAGVLRGDGLSTFLILSEPLVGPSGVALPEGALVTVAVETTGTGVAVPARIESGDQDPLAPGLQVPVLDGRIDFVVRAPTLADDFAGEVPVSIRAQVGTKSVCSGSMSMTFKNTVLPPEPNADVIYTAEDFSTFRNRELASSNASWNTKTGTLTISPFDAGDGRDGSLDVPNGQTVNLSTHSVRNRPYADAAYARIAEFGPAGDSLALISGASLAPFIEPGTRLLIINQQGTRQYDGVGNIVAGTDRVASVGAWEIVVVAGTRDGAIQLTAPVSRTFGQGGNRASDLADQAVYAYRLPQYERIQINGTLTANAWGGVGAGGGILALYARSADQSGAGNLVSSTGRIDMDGRGFRGATAAGQPAVASHCTPVGTHTPTNRFNTNGTTSFDPTLALEATSNVCGNYQGHGVDSTAHRYDVAIPSTSYYPAGGLGANATGFASQGAVTFDANRQNASGSPGGANDGTWRNHNSIANPTSNGPPGQPGGTTLPFSAHGTSFDSRVGEGPDGRLNELSRIAGYGSTPGGACCKNDYVQPNLAVGSGLTAVSFYLGAAAAHGTMPIAQSICDEANETVRTYGDSLLYDMFMGAGTGTVVRSQFNPCHTQRSCRPMVGGGCCRTYWNSLTAATPTCSRPESLNYTPPAANPNTSSAGTSSSGNWTITCAGGATRVADWRCNNGDTRTYCDGRASIKTEVYNGRNGGGIVWITASYLDLSQASAGAIRARGLDNTFTNEQGHGANPALPYAATQAGAAGGSIFIRADRLAPRPGTPGVVTAMGGAGAGAGRIRLDVGAFTATYADNFAQPAAVVSGTGTSEVSSRIVVDVSQRLDARRIYLANATIVNFGGALPLTASGAVDSAAAYNLSSLAVQVSANAGLARSNVVPPDDKALDQLGQQVRWYLSPVRSTSVGATRGLVIAVSQEPN